MQTKQNTKRHIKFPSTGHFDDFCTQLRRNPALNTKQTLRIEGTIKLHGTNAAVVLSPDGEIYFQSRERILTPESDNAGFAAFAEVNKSTFEDIFNAIKYLRMESESLIIYGEWAGGNIQAGVGLNHIPKSFFVFAIAIVTAKESEEDPDKFIWFPAWDVTREVQCLNPRVFSIHEFPKFELEFKSDNPAEIQNELIRITEEVERDCPVSRALLGPKFEGELVGEGVVWQVLNDYGNPMGVKFKVKGDKHAGNKAVRKLASVDPQFVKSVSEFVTIACRPGRLSQGIQYLQEMQIELTMQNIGQYLKWVNGDIIKEELPMLEASSLTMKDVGSAIARKAKEFYISKLKEV